jgi:hypothetical protein
MPPATPAPAERYTRARSLRFMVRGSRRLPQLLGDHEDLRRELAVDPHDLVAVANEELPESLHEHVVGDRFGVHVTADCRL